MDLWPVVVMSDSIAYWLVARLVDCSVDYHSVVWLAGRLFGYHVGQWIVCWAMDIRGWAVGTSL